MNVVLFITPRSVFQTLLPLSASDAGTSNESFFASCDAELTKLRDG
jgi:hypothetical protein